MQPPDNGNPGALAGAAGADRFNREPKGLGELTRNFPADASSPPAPGQCADCLHYRPFTDPVRPGIGECRQSRRFEYRLDDSAVYSVRETYPGDGCDGFTARRAFAARCKGRAA